MGRRRGGWKGDRHWVAKGFGEPPFRVLGAVNLPLWRQTDCYGDIDYRRGMKEEHRHPLDKLTRAQGWEIGPCGSCGAEGHIMIGIAGQPDVSTPACIGCVGRFGPMSLWKGASAANRKAFKDMYRFLYESRKQWYEDFNKEHPGVYSREWIESETQDLKEFAEGKVEPPSETLERERQAVREKNGWLIHILEEEGGDDPVSYNNLLAEELKSGTPVDCLPDDVADYCAHVFAMHTTGQPKGSRKYQDAVGTFRRRVWRTHFGWKVRRPMNPLELTYPPPEVPEY